MERPPSASPVLSVPFPPSGGPPPAELEGSAHGESPSAPASLTGLVPPERQARCRWVPGTFDRVRLSFEGAASGLELGLAWLRRVAGREAVDALYLTGRAEFRCDEALWRALGELAGHGRSGDARPA